ncbi:MAG: DUF4298 domain-containing protein [Ruminococcaceae bacterium]|nr:DUF4298 domain-containing protein [Oscillospiraceae bacterium]
MECIERIKQMEGYLDISSAAVEELSSALEKYIAVQDKLKALVDYYSSPQWMEDYEADEKGLIPSDLKRGVLSEDAVYNLLCDNKELLETIKTLITSN